MKTMQVLFVFLVCLLPSVVVANADILTLVDGELRHEVPIDAIRQDADLEFAIFDPFRGREVKIRGILLDQLLRSYFSRVPSSIKLTAHDEYALVFTGWQASQWAIVTHEDGQPLSLRSQGPLRLVQRQYHGRDPKNLRDFNDWVWMLKTIETQP